MSRFMVFLYGLVCYIIFFVTFLYLIGFVEGLVVPKTLHTGVQGSLGVSIVINVLLVALFGVQHAIMARPWFKAMWTKIVPRPMERATFVLATCICLVLIFWLWQPMPQTIWHLENPILRGVLIGLSLFGFLITFSVVLNIVPFGSSCSKLNFLLQTMHLILPHSVLPEHLSTIL